MVPFHILGSYVSPRSRTAWKASTTARHAEIQYNTKYLRTHNDRIILENTSLLAEAPRIHITETGNKTETKRLPIALIIGVKKGGTRAVLEYLRLHPDIVAPGPEPHFFDTHYTKGFEWYRNLMPETEEGQLTIEKTPSYFVTKGIPQKVYEMSKKTKLIVVLRDPVMRAISDYAQIAARNPEVKPFSEIVFENYDSYTVDTRRAIVKVGVYALHLTRWLEYFTLNQIHIVNGENLIRDPASELRDLQTFIGVKPHITGEHFTFNITKGFPCYRRNTSQQSWHCLSDDKGRPHPNVSSLVRSKLANFYRPFNHRLYLMTGKHFDWT
ncbi:hypothetical protein DPMN_026170 [Dreissena polymorpha]|uniref:Sulfotransferase domain-containing protein n=2 Tax=Dreissena polymorpha TaxID=45954 RepID=A0A9D4REB0_DREPO|nr:hypothetical protein DPMN_026170 [Dreissena polymorpha]